MTAIKICGLRRACDVEYVNAAGPDYAGFVFAKSRRQVTAEQARALRSGLAKSILSVGVFVNAPYEEVSELCRTGVIDVVQLHGQETEMYIEKLKTNLTNKITKAVRVETSEDILQWEQSAADMLLLDNGAGGTGRAFDWGQIPKKLAKPCFLAGGISLENVDAALAYAPYGLDISSGVETDGCKDGMKIREIVERIRGYRQIL